MACGGTQKECKHVGHAGVRRKWGKRRHVKCWGLNWIGSMAALLTIPSSCSSPKFLLHSRAPSMRLIRSLFAVRNPTSFSLSLVAAAAPRLQLLQHRLALRHRVSHFSLCRTTNLRRCVWTSPEYFRVFELRYAASLSCSPTLSIRFTSWSLCAVSKCNMKHRQNLWDWKSDFPVVGSACFLISMHRLSQLS